MKRIKLLLIMIGLIVAASSCVTPKEVNYLSDITPGNNIPLNDKFEAVITPYDQLRIAVIGSGSEKELAEPFNPFGSVQNMGANNNRVGYLVDVNGDIQFPTLGTLHVQGLTRLQLQDTITQKLVSGGYMNDPMVDVRFSNFRVFVLGTADGGKVLDISNERCTFLEALAMAGGLSQYTRRDKIAVIREIDGEMVTRYLDPRSADVFNDPFFLLQQNDIIVTQSFNRFYTQDFFNTSLSVFSTVISLVSSVSLVYLMLTGRN
ncbi:MAG: polysaccharide biosynthesis/export family protein [Bacteroidales bacterium]|nr:polysaccharide biosynthesis/export family protein [Bacteroidales bacterium]